MSTSHQIRNEDEIYCNISLNNERSKFLEQKKLPIFYFISILSLIFCFVLSAITIALYSKMSVSSSLDIEQSEKIQSVVNDTKIIQQRIDDSRKASYSGYKRLSDGWVTLFNGYKYKRTNRIQSWQQSRLTCVSWGGDLAVYGIQSMESRRILLNELSVEKSIYIGLRKVNNVWTWLKGGIAVPSAILWAYGEPNNDKGIIENCVDLRYTYNDTHNYGWGSNDSPCSTKRIGLCEKLLLQ